MRYRFKSLPAILTSLIILTWAGAGLCGTDNRKVSKDCSPGPMVSTACPRATAVGVEILDAGGNAVDAAIAVGFALAVTFPEAGNIGGGGFMLVRTSSGEEIFIDFREKAPLSAHEKVYLDEDGEIVPEMSTMGHGAAGVPGTVAGLYKAWQLHGSMPWEVLLAPAVRLAGEGFAISFHLSHSLRRLMKYDEAYPALKKYLGENGEALDPGDRLRQPELASVLMLIAEEGPDVFYRGNIARLIVEEIKRGGGMITIEDMNSYEAVLRTPVSGSYRGNRVISAPPPSAGGIVLLEILNIIEGFDLPGEHCLSEKSVHWMVEAEKRAYHDRSLYLGDPDFVDIPVDVLLSREHADRLRSTIGESSTSSLSLQAADPIPAESEETTHYSIIDGKGNAVAVTTTLNSSYGCKVVIPGCGFLLNNEMDDFSIKPGAANIYGLTGGKANSIQPGKRMLSSMAPTIVTRDGKVQLILGTPGGSTIITTVAQLLIDIIDFGMSPEEAVSAPRFHHQWTPDVIYYEKDGMPQALIESLVRRGHALKERIPIGDAQLIMVLEEVTCGVSDPRRGGRSLGTE